MVTSLICILLQGCNKLKHHNYGSAPSPNLKHLTHAWNWNKYFNVLAFHMLISLDIILILWICICLGNMVDVVVMLFLLWVVFCVWKWKHLNLVFHVLISIQQPSSTPITIPMLVFPHEKNAYSSNFHLLDHLSIIGMHDRV